MINRYSFICVGLLPVSAMLWIGVFVVASPASGQAPESVPSPNAPVLVDPKGPLLTREFRLKHVRASEVRILLCGTLLAVPPHLVVFNVDASDRQFILTDTPERVKSVSDVLPAIDQPSQEQDIQRRLMEMWVRLVLSYGAKGFPGT